MALIPVDAAIHLRMQTETGLTPITPLREVSPDLANLPNLRPGQTFTAQIQQALPDNSYRALAGGKEIMLSLQETVKSGDTLELVVVDRNLRTVVAQRATPTSLGTEENGVATHTAQLSPAAQLIGKLLLPAGEKPQPVPLNQGIPLLSRPLPAVSNLAAMLAPKLQQAAGQSGLFYESHQALWLAGQRSSESLMCEPQALHSTKGSAAASPAAAQNEQTNKNLATAGLALATATKEIPSETTISVNSAITGSKDLMQTIPSDLRPLVQQQLDTAATQRLSWQGEVWPGQTMQWQISRDAPDKPASAPRDAEQWNTSVALTTPRLGRVEAVLGIAGNTVRIRLAVDLADSVPKLNSRLPGLQSALEAAGLRPIGLHVKNNEPA